MDLLFWITVGFIIIGFVVLAFIKRNMESKKSSTTQSIVWWIVGNTVWGIASIILIVGWFSKIK
ncbi:hypothetical protein QNH20_13065 [Neobacillus sp. WH10]|uniref:hypothetical protein n=1 Tax=Neobacillus sp. WH10 TaxID=3047873 RepID=UPI0024C160B0|nr:hypothetical protein [Neobacillus sp. WH10]WHY80009.1 hypothetical protein QNH20_13065 [Neobacillus sp. WH10]